MQQQQQQQQQRLVKRVKRRGSSSNEEVKSHLVTKSTREVARLEAAEAERGVSGEHVANGAIPVHAKGHPSDSSARGISDAVASEARNPIPDGSTVHRGRGSAESDCAVVTARGAGSQAMSQAESQAGSQAGSQPLKAARAPIDELLHWHTGIRQELSAFEADLKGLSQKPGSVACLLKRCRFLADMCTFHR